ncbi:TPA: VOC family protein [Candidatus Saccharibacteria bacterium]|nr:VOC family protein [Candidatus Saccharibacteria bacterium]HIO87561.1 VOC family protein [Candidatus Saccharibacteria bacterium]
MVKVAEFRLKLFPKDFYKVRNFYEDQLGFKVVNEWDHEDKKGVMFTVGPAILELLWEKDQATPEYRSSDVSWRVDDVWSIWEEYKGKECIVFELRDNSWGDTSFFIKDPEGFRITFFTELKAT